MKLLYLTDQVYQHGGAEKILIQKANFWADVYGYEVVVLTASQKGRGAFFPLSDKVRLHDLGMEYPKGSLYHPRNFGRFRQQYARLKAFADDFRPDAVFVVSQTIFRQITPFACKGFRTFYESHTTWYGFKLAYDRQSPAMKIKTKIIAAITRFCESKYTKVVYLNPSELEHHNRPNAVVIPNFFDVTEERNPAIERRNIAISLGRLSFPKGYDLLIEAWGMLDSKIENWEMHVYGDGEDREKLENQLARTNFRNPFRFLPAINKVNEKLSEASLYVMSSKFETFPLVLLEAMSNGLPIVSFDCPTGPRSIVTPDRDGILVPALQTGELADAVIKLMNDPELRREMGEHGRENVRRFSAEKVMKQWDDLIRST